jgi:hypothetical protein
LNFKKKWWPNIDLDLRPPEFHRNFLKKLLEVAEGGWVGEVGWVEVDGGGWRRRPAALGGG